MDDLDSIWQERDRLIREWFEKIVWPRGMMKDHDGRYLDPYVAEMWTRYRAGVERRAHTIYLLSRECARLKGGDKDSLSDALDIIAWAEKEGE